MCGICGVVYKDPAHPADRGTITAMRDSLMHRGPDDEGIYISGGVGLGHRRLSVIDLSSFGRQPMATPDNRYQIIYNGEIFNYQELRVGLEVSGVEFKTKTDTEVLLWLYVKYGPEMLHKLNGMFSFAIWDDKKKELFAARDRFGIKPFYYAVTSEGLYFASEEKALFAAEVPKKFDHDCWEELIYFRFVSGDRTPYKEVYRLLPGHYLVWRTGDLKIVRWWNLLEQSKKYQGYSPEYLKSQYLETFEDAIKLINISDVSLGVLLSGGLDSGSIAATLARSIPTQLAGFTNRFADPHYDEGLLAAQVAQKWEMAHHEVLVDPSRLLSLIQEASWFSDEPLAQGDDIFIYNISRYAKSYATVLLSGEGADETLGGYIRYRPLLYGPLMNFLRPWFPKAIHHLRGHSRLHKLGAFLEMGDNDKIIYFNTSNILPAEVKQLGIPNTMPHFSYRDKMFDEARRYSSEPVRQRMYIDQHTFLTSLLHRNDRMTMGASVECRVPFLDYRLATLAAAMPTNEFFSLFHGKKILRHAMKTRLPLKTVQRQKWGFAVPWERFLREKGLADFLNEMPDMEPLVSGPLDRKVIRAYVNDYLSGSNRHYLFLVEILLIVIWYQTIFTKNQKYSRS